MKRCKMRKGNGMLLREYLKEWTKEDLLNEARSYELKNCSRLKKDDLIDRIVEYLTTKEALRGRLSCLTKEQMALFCKACTADSGTCGSNRIKSGSALCLHDSWCTEQCDQPVLIRRQPDSWFLRKRGRPKSPVQPPALCGSADQRYLLCGI